MLPDQSPTQPRLTWPLTLSSLPSYFCVSPAWLSSRLPALFPSSVYTHSLAEHPQIRDSGSIYILTAPKSTLRPDLLPDGQI